MKQLFKLPRAIIFIFFASILFMQNAYAREVKFIQITDSHFASSSKEYTQREVEGAQQVLINTIADINKISDVDFVAFTGDNIDQANSSDLKAFLKIANKLNVPYYVVIGNHEVFKSQKFGKKEYLKIVSKYSKNCRPKSPNYTFRKNGFLFVVLDGAKEDIPGPSGYYKKPTLCWLDKVLTKNENSKVVILQHFPLIEPSHNRSHITYKKEDYENVLKKHTNVVAICSGHFHANGEFKKDGIYHISTPALVEGPHNYKIIEIEKTKESIQIYTQLRYAQ